MEVGDNILKFDHFRGTFQKRDLQIIKNASDIEKTSILNCNLKRGTFDGQIFPSNVVHLVRLFLFTANML